MGTVNTALLEAAEAKIVEEAGLKQAATEEETKAAIKALHGRYGIEDDDLRDFAEKVAESYLIVLVTRQASAEHILGAAWATGFHVGFMTQELLKEE